MNLHIDDDIVNAIKREAAMPPDWQAHAAQVAGIAPMVVNPNVLWAPKATPATYTQASAIPT